MSRLRIALLQLRAVPDDAAAAWEKAEAWCREAARQGADIALLPEMWSVGYRFPSARAPQDLAAWRGRAIAGDDAALGRIAALARELGLAIGATYLERWDPLPRNALTLFDRHGEAVLTYRKVHTCAFGDECLLTPGDDFPVCALDTAAGPVRVGAMICYDREFPESARLLMLGGAELILVPNACPWDAPRQHQLESRAFENMVAIALANYPAPDQNGGSTLLDGMAYTAPPAEGDGQARDMTLCRGGTDEAIVLGDLDLQALRDYRGRETWGDAYRRPERYGALCAAAGAVPAVRGGRLPAPGSPQGGGAARR